MGPMVNGSDAQTWSGTGPLEGRGSGTESSVFKRKNLVQRAVAGEAQWVKCGPEAGDEGVIGHQAALKRSPRVLMGVQQRHLWQKGTQQADKYQSFSLVGEQEVKTSFPNYVRTLVLQEKFAFSHQWVWR